MRRFTLNMIATALCLAMLLGACGFAVAEESPEDRGSAMENAIMGYTVTFPEWFNELKGVLTFSKGQAINDDFIVAGITYYPIPDETLNAMTKVETRNFEQQRILSVFALRNMTGTEYLTSVGYTPEEIDAYFEVTTLATDEDFGWYLIVDRYEPLDDTEFQREYEAVYAGIVDSFTHHAEYCQPITADPAVGQTLRFEATDVYGNAVNSEEIFGAHVITMVNCWGTACPPCIEELPILAAMNNRLADKDCAVIGVVIEAEGPDDVDIIGEAKSIMSECGVDFPVIVPNDAISGILQPENYPTSYFVDREGKVLDSFADTPELDDIPNGYEKIIDALLSGDEPAASRDSMPAMANSVGTYRVIVTDEAGNPIEGVVVQFCDDTACRIGKTDADGAVSFEAEEKVYDVHVLKVPQGWHKDETQYKTLETGSDLTITLQAN